MDPKTIEEVKRLPPKERMKRIEELKKKAEEDRKRQEQDMQKAMQDSLKEIELDQMLQEIEVPKAKEVKVEELFQKGKDIEEKINAERIKTREGGGTDYGARLDEMLPHQTIQQWYQNETPAPTESEFFEMYDRVKEEYDQKKAEPIGAGGHYQSQSEQSAENIVESLNILKKMGYKHGFF
ncbi:TPA: hypothetical protein HA265_04835 [Candidatus Woesearchaeota archaeon]|nr:hypothetical protein [Candidatus Woesearchaeota archaeon]